MGGSVRIAQGLLRAARGSIFLLLLPPLVRTSQAQDVPKLQLKIKGQIPVSGGLAALFLDPVRCDAKGNVYLRIVEGTDAYASPVTKISREGKVAAVFSSTAVSGFEKSQLISFAVGLRGEVYGLVLRLVSGQREIDVLTFADDGTFRFATKLEPVFTPIHLAVFQTGDFLVSGWKPIPNPAPPAPGPSPVAPSYSSPGGAGQRTPRTPPPVEPFTAVVDRSGRVLKEITLDQEGASSDPAGSSRTRGFPSVEIALGEAAPGDDGNIYLMFRKATAPQVYVISAAGIVVRSFKVAPPNENDQEVAMAYSVGGKLIFEFQHKIDDRTTDWKNAIFSVVDAETGARELDYQSSAEIGGGYSCYSPNDGFTFIRNTKERQLLLSRVGP